MHGAARHTAVARAAVSGGLVQLEAGMRGAGRYHLNSIQDGGLAGPVLSDDRGIGDDIDILALEGMPTDQANPAKLDHSSSSGASSASAGARTVLRPSSRRP